MPSRPPRYTPSFTAARPRPDGDRPSSHARGYTRRWQRLSKLFLDAHPLCTACTATGRTTAATCVDHVTPHRGDQSLFWDEDNWQPLCANCHSAKTARGE